MKVNERKIIKYFHGFILLLPIILFIVYGLSIFRANISISDIFTNYSNFVFDNLAINFLNFEDILLWVNTNLFNSNTPPIILIVLLHLAYYIVVEILILIFDALFFIVHFARKWVGGFYA